MGDSANLDRLLAHAATVVGTVWLDALPAGVIDVWWSRGDLDRIHGVQALRGPAEAALRRSRFAALDPDRGRATRIALAAISEVAPHELPAVGSWLWHLGAEVQHALVAALHERGDRERATPWSRLSGADPLALARIADPRARVVALAASADPPTHDRRAVLAMLWHHGGANPDDDTEHWRRIHADVLALALATRALDAWDLVPVLQRPATCRTAVEVGAIDTVERWIVDTDERTALEMVTSIATVRAPPPRWHTALHAEAARADADYEEGILTGGEREWRRWAALACDREAIDQAIVDAVVGAHAAATTFGDALVQPPPPASSSLAKSRVVVDAWREGTKSRGRVMASVERVARVGDLSATLGMIDRAGQRGELALVIEAIDRIEATRGPLTAMADRSALAALAHYGGRSRELLERVPLNDFPRAVASTCAALARDGYADDAQRYAAALLARPHGAIDRDSFDLVARAVLDTQGQARLAALLDRTLATLPGATVDGARRWLAEPYASMP